ncbi:hypothetical protein BDP27DRAFT_1327660 [Rhodocollybia butyracea]|uniref:Uncharacterized protein n=1 Tax=Rhodocollybia butyracea TaxID=206335 RepID=A0A9P5PT96_9AGAR|nr:hypothetical protein BDP27DRAFT_1327660 [Rhodocollybia butyracea]
MQNNHRHFKTQAVKVRRGEAFQKVDYGTMGARGSQYGGPSPIGRFKGEMSLDKKTVDGYVGNWFKMAVDNALVLQPVRQASKRVGQKIMSAATEAGTLPLGKYGLNQYYCYDYIAPLHYDSDRTFTMSTTTARGGNLDHYNFCYAKWGVIVYTQENCQWWFDGNEIHGTASPSRSALARVKTDGPFSDGFVIVLREKDAKAAEEMHEAVKRIPYLCQYWS